VQHQQQPAQHLQAHRQHLANQAAAAVAAAVAARQVEDPILKRTLFFMALSAADFSWHHARAKYRRMLSKLRKELQVPETLMCAQRWAEVEFAKVPSLSPIARGERRASLFPSGKSL
jgi:hypothetical protein